MLSNDTVDARTKRNEHDITSPFDLCYGDHAGSPLERHFRNVEICRYRTLRLNQAEAQATRAPIWYYSHDSATNVYPHNAANPSPCHICISRTDTKRLSGKIVTRGQLVTTWQGGAWVEIMHAYSLFLSPVSTISHFSSAPRFSCTVFRF